MNEEHPFSENADLIRAIEDAPPRGDIPLPQHLLFKLESTRRAALTGSGALPAAVTPTSTSPAPRRTPLPVRFLWAAAALLILGISTWFFIPREVGTAHVVITSPGDAISSTQPTIAWNSKDKPGQKYDVWILPSEGNHLEVPELFKAERVTSPVSFASLTPGKDIPQSTLQPGRDYRVLVCLADSGRLAGVPIAFKVNPAPAP